VSHDVAVESGVHFSWAKLPLPCKLYEVKGEVPTWRGSRAITGGVGDQRSDRPAAAGSAFALVQHFLRDVGAGSLATKIRLVSEISRKRR